MQSDQQQTHGPGSMTNTTAGDIEKEADRDEIDEAAEESFPASDPPSFNGTSATPTNNVAEDRSGGKTNVGKPR